MVKTAQNKWAHGAWIGSIDVVLAFSSAFPAALYIRWFFKFGKKHQPITFPNLSKDNNHEKLLSEFKLLFWQIPSFVRGDVKASDIVWQLVRTTGSVS